MIHKGGRSVNRVPKGVLVVAIVVAFGISLGCASTSSQKTLSAGLYEWEWSKRGGDFNLEVGHPFMELGAFGICMPGGTSSNSRNSINWSANTRIISGSLPPGLKVTNKHGYGSIEGIPTERGHWIITQEIYNISCAGKFYGDEQRVLRFHITGSGKVIQ